MRQGMTRVTTTVSTMVMMEVASSKPLGGVKHSCSISCVCVVASWRLVQFA